MADRVIVVGAGVVGLTCALRLLEAGHRVDVVARDLPRETTSAVAAGFWYPYRALTRLNLGGLPEVPGTVVVNCSGLGARLLGADRTVVPVRGQVVHVEPFG